MGVFHVMGLGMSPGAVTSVLYYLKDRLADPKNCSTFFGQSGEWKQRRASDEAMKRPPGYIQGIALLTTPELYSGSRKVRYEKDGKLGEGKAVDIVRAELTALHKDLTHDTRAKVELLVAEIPFRNFERAFERSLAVVQALHPPGRTGKEVWVNLTAGDNTLVLALHVVAALTGIVSRLYCINVPKDHEQRLMHPVASSKLGSSEDTFWVDLPYIAVQDNQLRSLTLKILEDYENLLDDTEVLSRVRNEWASPVALPDIEQFRRQILHPMEAQQLIVRDDEHKVRIGPLGKRLKKYFQLAGQPTEVSSLRKLAETNSEWTHWEEL